MPEKTPNQALVDFLVGEVVAPAPVPAETVEVIAVPPIAAEPIPPLFPDSDITDLMALMKRIGMAAKNLHYRAKGKPFYSLHQLSDLVYDVEHITDYLAEVYFLGERGIEPPLMEVVCGSAAALECPAQSPEDDKGYVRKLFHFVIRAMNKVEIIKKAYPDLKSGVVALLDNISQKCLLSIGLLDQTLKG